MCVFVCVCVCVCVSVCGCVRVCAGVRYAFAMFVGAARMSKPDSFVGLMSKPGTQSHSNFKGVCSGFSLEGRVWVGGQSPHQRNVFAQHLLCD